MTESNLDTTSLEARIAKLEKKVALLDDIEALRRLRMTYHDYVNEGRWAEIADLFTEETTTAFVVVVCIIIAVVEDILITKNKQSVLLLVCLLYDAIG